MIFHIDANSFYAACERLFRPDLLHTPIAVLSNNDGIIVALNQECKDLGFKRGDVYFKEMAKLEKSGVVVFSSNYTLYADISARLNLIYCRLCSDVEVYSIDESFLYFPNWRTADLAEAGRVIRSTVLQEVGIPVSVGIAPTKTLAKMCNKLAKKRGGVCCWDELDKDAELKNYPVGDLWGIGHAKTELLNQHGVQTAYDLKNYPLHHAKKQLTVMGFRTVQELNEIAAIDRVERAKRQNICSSRSFADAVDDLSELKVALADYTQEAVKRMREERSACRYVSVYLMTNPYSEVGEQYCNCESAELPAPSSYLPDILGTAIMLLERIYRSGFRYRKVMINLLGLEDDKVLQQDFFIDTTAKERENAFMDAFDSINERYGRGTVHLGVRDHPSEAENWKMKRDYLSPEYTTNYRDIPVVV
jgi:DNA polymerase V